jgi:membrane-bound lytic murein transglycosylase D
VAKGEYLGTIARMYNTTINDLLELNSLSDTNIKEGDKLIVGKEVVTTKAKKGKEDYAATIKKANQKLYQVKQGDTLSSIAKKFPGVTIADLEKANNIKSENLKPGMKLKIGG